MTNSEPRHALDAILRPRSVAVIGASRKKQSVGRELLHNLLEYEFQGQVFPVNPSATVVHSVKAYPTVEAIPDPVDLAIVAVPSAMVLEVVEACGRKGVRGLVVITAGFREVGEAGAALENTVRAAAAKHGMRLVGPNCMGVINTDPAVRLNGSFSSAELLPGNVAFCSQSGALGEAILASMRQLGLGLSMFVSLGNKADVSGNDVIEYWEDDPQTKAILMYLESFGNPRHFVNLARRVTRKKPILVMKSGRTAAGARAAISHTGSLAGADVAVESLLAQCGVIRANSITELFVCASAFSTQPIPLGNRVAIVGNAGGPGILAADACAQLGLEIPTLDPKSQFAMRGVLAPEASVANPVDMIATARGEAYSVCLRAVAVDPNVDSLIVIFTSVEWIDSLQIADGILAGLQECRKPALICFMGKLSSKEAIEKMRAHGLPVYTYPEDAAQALHALVRHRQWLDRPVGTVVRFDDFQSDPIRELFDGVRAEGRRDLTLVEAQRIVEATGIQVTPWFEAASAEHAGSAADGLGYPVALKLSSSVVLHKSEFGGVRLGLRTRSGVEAAASEMLARVSDLDPKASLLVQRMVPTGTEVIFGASTEPKFGPLMMFGLGGIFVEILKDVAFRLHPISDLDASEMIRSIKGFPILAGARGHASVDLETIEETLLRLSQLLSEFPEIQEFDINPFMATSEKATSAAVDARFRLA